MIEEPAVKSIGAYSFTWKSFLLVSSALEKHTAGTFATPAAHAILLEPPSEAAML